MPDRFPIPAPGAPAPDFHLVSHTGEALSLATWRGTRAVTLYFMREFT
jgi:peroxiredoxin